MSQSWWPQVMFHKSFITPPDYANIIHIRESVLFPFHSKISNLCDENEGQFQLKLILNLSLFDHKTDQQVKRK